MFSEMIAFCCLTCDEFWEVNGANDRNRSVCLCSSWRGSYGEWGFTVTVFFLCRPFSIDRPQFLPLLRKQNKTKPLEDRFYILTFIKKVIIQFRVILFILVQQVGRSQCVGCLVVRSGIGHLTVSETLPLHGDKCRKHFTIK